MYHVPLAVQCIYGWSGEEGEDVDGKEGSESHGGWERVEIAWPLVYGSETMLRREKERSRVRDVQMDKLRGLLGIRRMDRVPNARIRELLRNEEGLDERIDEGVLRWFGHVERWRGIGSLRESM